MKTNNFEEKWKLQECYVMYAKLRNSKLLIVDSPAGVNKTVWISILFLFQRQHKLSIECKSMKDKSWKINQSDTNIFTYIAC